MLCLILVLASLGLGIWDGLLVGAVGFDILRPSGPADAVAWLEPVMITMGFSGVYNLLRLVDRKVQGIFGK